MPSKSQRTKHPKTPASAPRASPVSAHVMQKQSSVLSGDGAFRELLKQVKVQAMSIKQKWFILPSKKETQTHVKALLRHANLPMLHQMAHILNVPMSGDKEHLKTEILTQMMYHLYRPSIKAWSYTVKWGLLGVLYLFLTEILHHMSTSQYTAVKMIHLALWTTSWLILIGGGAAIALIVKSVYEAWNIRRQLMLLKTSPQ